jgi:hypothetical protein
MLVSSHVFVMRSGPSGYAPPPKDMTQAREALHANDQAAATARRDDGAEAFEPFPGTTSSGTSASWFVPPIVVPAFFAVLIIISVIYQRSWQFPG